MPAFIPVQVQSTVLMSTSTTSERERDIDGIVMEYRIVITNVNANVYANVNVNVNVITNVNSE